MMEGIKPYTDYKDTGQAWTGAVPDHWDVRPVFGAFQENHEKNTGMKENTVLSLSYGRIIIKPIEKLRGLVPESFETYQIVNPGDIVVRTTDLQNDHTSLRMGYVKDRGIITSAYLALKVKNDVLPEYGFQILNVWDLSKAIYGYGSGLRQNLGFGHFKRMLIAVPPHDEQAAIVKFLNYMNNKVDKAIKAKRKTIALLTEQKQSIIHHAVTRGLDSKVKLKDTGVNWIGSVPAHWSSRKIRNILTPFNERNRPDLPLLSVVREQGVIVRDVENMESNHNFIPDDLSNYKVVRSGQFVMNKMKAWQGSYGVSEFDGIVSPAYFVFNLASITPDFFHLAIRSKAYVPSFTQASDGVRVGQWDLSISKMKEILFFYPNEEEQKRIVSYVNQRTRKFSVAISTLLNEISLLTEYRTRLISDVVTGKLDVREAAKNLPAEIITEPSDDLIDGDEEEIEEAA